jgi:hypothetical protein
MIATLVTPNVVLSVDVGGDDSRSLDTHVVYSMGVWKFRPSMYIGQRSKSFTLFHSSAGVKDSQFSIELLLGSLWMMQFIIIVSSCGLNHPFFPHNNPTTEVGLDSMRT